MESARRTVAAASIVIRTAVVIALLLVAYFAVTRGWIGTAVDSFSAWYNDTVAPHLWVDLVGEALEPTPSPTASPSPDPTVAPTASAEPTPEPEPSE